ncbi:MAG: NEW3 domain-containing protein [Candidatus Nanohaloarchaea archaeon]|nr:NEW3 domain-containing protein [Candidatus Nanohaloarchaea archaeon]
MTDGDTGRRRSIVLLTVTFLLLSTFAVSIAANNVDLTPDYSQSGEQISVFNVTLNQTGGSPGGHNLTALTLNFTGSNSTVVSSLVKNVTVEDDGGTRFGYNRTPSLWQASGDGLLFNISNENDNVDDITANHTNLTVDVHIKSGAASGDSINLTLTSIYSTNLTAWPNLPFVPGGSTVVDDIPPNGTNDVNLTTANFTSLNYDSPLVQRVMASTGVGLNWSGYDFGTELNDSLSGVDSIEIFVRNRSFNASSQKVNSDWTDWYSLNGSIQAGMGAANNTTTGLSSNYQYEFNLTVNDTLGNTNWSASNLVNVTLDTTPPEMALEADGSNITTPYNWTNRSSLSPSINITDVSGLYGWPHQNYSTNYVNLTFWNATSQGTNQTYTNVSLIPSSNASEIRVESVESFDLIQDATVYNVTINATDLSGNTGVFNWTFTTDFTKPDSVSVASTAGKKGNGWWRDRVYVSLSCSDSAASSNSGVADAAAFRGGTRRTPWNSSLNVTLTNHGEHTYDFACRDVAGNVNSSFNKTYSIDGHAPTVASDVEETYDNTDLSFTYWVNLTHNETTESGLDTGASAFNLTDSNGEQPVGSTSVTWNGQNIRVDISDLSYDTGYDLHYTLIDNVDHNTSTTGYGGNTAALEFDTKEESSDSGGGGSSGGSGGGGGGSGSGTTLQSSMALQSVPGSVSVNQGANTTFQFTLENDGDTTLNGIDVSIEASGITVEADPSTLSLGPGGTNTVTASVSVPADATTGIYEATINATADDGTSTTATVDIEVLVAGTQVNIQDTPGDISVPQGNESTVTFTVKNSGDTTASANFSFTVLNTSIDTTPASADIGSGDRQTVDATVAPTNTTGVGVYTGTFTVAYDGDSASASIDVKVQPDTEAEQSAINTSIQELEQTFERSRGTMNQSTAAEVQGLISQANTALDRGDYATAAQLQDRIEQKLETGGGGGGGSLPLIPIAAGVIILAILGFVAYLVLPESHQEAGKQTVKRTGEQAKDTWSEMGPVRPSKSGDEYEYGQDSALDRVKDVVGGAVASIAAALGSITDRGGGEDEGLREAVQEQQDAETPDSPEPEDELTGDDFDYDFTER